MIEAPPERYHRLALGLAALAFALHLRSFSQYDFFRDELYFIVCGRHPAFGYVDQPPLVPLLAAGSQAAGESLWLLRAIAASAHAAAVFAACAIVRRLGGGRGAEAFAGLATATSPLLLGVTATLGTTALEPLTWTLLAYAVLRAVRENLPRWWIVAGIIAGIALEDKYTIAFLLLALVAGIALAGPRATFARREFWIGVAATIALAAPNLVWQSVHGWPFVELLRTDANGKNVVLGPVAWLLAQVLNLSPLYAPVWIAGVVALCLRSRERFLGIAVVLLFVAVIALKAKDYYIAGIYPLLFAAGCCAIERGVRPAALRHTYAALAGLGALALAPLAIPLISEPAYVAYAATLHVRPAESEHHRAAALPQLFADMHGWRELADRVSAVERALSPADRDRAAVFTQDYGEAAAIDVFGDRTIPVISGHNNYWLWGSHGTHPVLIIVGGDLRDHEAVFRDVRRVEVVRSPYAMPSVDELPIFLARDPRVDIEAIWPQLRHYD